jgi:type IV pilus assembly protein PilW
LPRSSENGFTLAEMLVAMTISLLVVGVVLSLAMASRNVYSTDEARTRLDQDLSAARDLVAADVLSAGERLAADFPAVLIKDGAGAADELTVRRNLVEVVLPACTDVAGGDTQIEIAQPVAPPPGCAPQSDGDADGWPDNVQVWRAHRLGAGGSARAYLFDPVNRRGEFFDYVAEDAALYAVRADPATVWTNAYPALNQCRVYLIEEHAYTVSGDVLQLVVDGAAGSPINVVFGVADFQVAASLPGGVTRTTFSGADAWRDIVALDLEFTGRTLVRGRPFERRLSTAVLPRNVLSR